MPSSWRARTIRRSGSTNRVVRELAGTGARVVGTVINQY
jgi:hypothetical protein